MGVSRKISRRPYRVEIGLKCNNEREGNSERMDEARKLWRRNTRALKFSLRFDAWNAKINLHSILRGLSMEWCEFRIRR